MQNCPDCFGKRWYAKISPKTGLQLKDSEGRLLWRCFRCGYIAVENSPSLIPLHIRTGANILYIDLEVSLTALYNYGLKVPSKYIPPANIEHEYYIISWSASYLHESKIYTGCVTSEQARAWDDSQILAPLHDLMQSADIIAGHNVDAYDMKRANTRFLKAGLGVVEGKKTYDTLKIARGKLALESNTLDYIERWLGLRPKDNITRDDWLKIVKDADEKTLAKILKYNKGDVREGKEVLKRFIPFSGKKKDYGTKTIN